MRNLVALSLVLATAVGLPGCTSTDPTDPTPGATVASVTVTPSSPVTLQAIGATQTFTAEARDGAGAVIAGKTASWSSSATGVASVSGTGVATAAANGTATITATIDGKSGTASLTVAQVATAIRREAGNNQSGVANEPVPVAPAAKVVDVNDHGVAGVAVTFAVASGGGSLTGGSATTDANGVATVASWTLGGAGTNTMTATTPGLTGSPLTFTATALTTLFDIELRYVAGTTPTASQADIFADAALRWETLLTGDLSAVTFSNQAIACVTGSPVLNETVDDLIIFVEFEDIDGAGGVLGQAGPCAIRSGGSPDPALPVVGRMLFDSSDVAALELSGNLDETILHEMGHVLGFGTLWNQPVIDLLRSPTDTAPATPQDTHFDGAAAVVAFNDAGGAGYADAKVPVENDNAAYGAGSLNAHWRESVFATELMTPALNGGLLNPLSEVTVAAMEDMGFEVNTAGVDLFVVPLVGPGPADRARRGTLLLYDDVLRHPIVVVDAAGRLEAVIRR